MTWKVNRILAKAKRDNILTKLGFSGSVGNFRIVCFNDSSLGNLKDRRSRGSFIDFDGQ